MKGIEKNTFIFLKNLEKNNNRDWFNENKNDFEIAKANVLEFVENLLVEMNSFDNSMSKVDAKKSLFRIYRDTRFSKDKRPYKTNFGASINGIGKKDGGAGYYLHISSGECFIAGGVYMPETATLKNIRKEISVFSNDFKAIIDDKNFKKYFKNLSEDSKLQKIPQGFDKEDPMAEFLKLKNFVVFYPIKDEDLTEKDSIKNLSKVYKAMKPLIDFLNRSLE